MGNSSIKGPFSIIILILYLYVYTPEENIQGPLYV